MNNLIRCFVSLDVSVDARLELIRLQKELKKQKLFTGSFTKDDMFHLTIKFLGEIDKFKLEEIKNRLSKIDFNTIKIRLDSLGFFGDLPDVIWAGVHCDDVVRLYNLIEDNIWDILPSQRRFHPHITLARVKNTKHRMLLKKSIEEISVNPVEFEVSSFELKESKVVNGLVEHNILERYLLK